MEIPTWLISLLGGVGGALLTLITTLIVNRISYRHEYYKMIIDKRIEAYNTIELLLKNLKSIRINIPSSNDFNKDNIYNPIHLEIAKAKSHSLWLSREMNDSLDRFGLHLLHYELVIEKNKDESFKKFDIFESIQEHEQIIEQILRNDLTSLHKVRNFLRKKNHC